MKIVLDLEKKLTRGDSKDDKKIVLSDDVKITHTPLDLFAKMGLPHLTSNIIVIDEKSAFEQYKQLRDLVLSDTNLQNQIDANFLASLRNKRAEFDDVNLQKVTYKLDSDENFDDVIKTLEKQNSNSIFRA